jgi:subtilisin family serine protease
MALLFFATSRPGAAPSATGPPTLAQEPPPPPGSHAARASAAPPSAVAPPSVQAPPSSPAQPTVDTGPGRAPQEFTEPELSAVTTEVIDGQPTETVRDSWIIRVSSDADASVVADELADRYGGEVQFTYNELGAFSITAAPSVAEEIASDPRVDEIDQDRVAYPTDHGLSSYPWRFGLMRMHVGEAFAAGYTGQGVRIAILDTGVNDSSALTSTSGAGLVDRATSFACAGPNTFDGSGHGSAVAGSAAGVYGVARNATIVSVRVFANGNSTTSSAVLCGINYVKALNANGNPADDIDVANLSLSGSGSCGAVCPAMNSAMVTSDRSPPSGVVFTLAAGNNGADAANYWPGSNPQAVTVSALSDADGTPAGDAIWSGSNRGSTIDVTAPGVSIYSNGVHLTGTSLSAPHVAGVGALIRSRQPSMATTAVRDLIVRKGTCPNGTVNDTTGPCFGKGLWGADEGITEPLADAYNAALEAAGGGPPPPPPPSVPGKPTLVSPTGSVTDPVTYRWNAVNGAASYLLSVDNGSSVQTSYTASQAGCGTGSGTCSVTPGATLVFGNHTWTVQASNTGGSGPPSDAGSFITGKPTQLSPSGVTSNPIIHRWNRVPGAAWYYVWVDGATAHAGDAWLSAEQLSCAGTQTTCVLSPGYNIPSGNYAWWVVPWKNDGLGVWSDGLAFAVP